MTEKIRLIMESAPLNCKENIKNSTKKFVTTLKHLAQGGKALMSLCSRILRKHIRGISFERSLLLHDLFLGKSLVTQDSVQYYADSSSHSATNTHHWPQIDTVTKHRNGYLPTEPSINISRMRTSGSPIGSIRFNLSRAKISSLFAAHSETIDHINIYEWSL